MSPTSYQTAPPRISIIAIAWSAVKPCGPRTAHCPQATRPEFRFLSLFNTKPFSTESRFTGASSMSGFELRKKWRTQVEMGSIQGVLHDWPNSLRVE
jgi:hypothetical protein